MVSLKSKKKERKNAKICVSFVKVKKGTVYNNNNIIII